MISILLFIADRWHNRGRPAVFPGESCIDAATPSPYAKKDTTGRNLSDSAFAVDALSILPQNQNVKKPCNP